MAREKNKQKTTTTLCLFFSQLYFFTVEFGMCKQDGELRVYGAGLLSSVAELQHAITSTEKQKRFDPEITCREECIITAYQNAYYYTDSIEEAKEKMRQVHFATGFPSANSINPLPPSDAVRKQNKNILENLSSSVLS